MARGPLQVVADDGLRVAFDGVDAPLAQGPTIVGRNLRAHEQAFIAPGRDHIDEVAAFVEQVQRARVVRKDLARIVRDDRVGLLERAAHLQIGVERVDELHLLVVLGQLELRQAQLVLVVLAFGDVGRGADVAGEFPLVADVGFADVEHVAVLTVGAAQPVFHLEALVRDEGFLIGAEAGLHVVGVQCVYPGVAIDVVVRGGADEFLPLRIGEHHLALGVGHPEHDRGIFSDNLEVGIADDEAAPGVAPCFTCRVPLVAGDFIVVTGHVAAPVVGRRTRHKVSCRKRARKEVERAVRR